MTDAKLGRHQPVKAVTHIRHQQPTLTLSAVEWWLANKQSTRNQSSHIDLHTHAYSAFDYRVTLTFDFWTSGSMRAKRLPCTVCLPSLVLIAQVVFP